MAESGKTAAIKSVAPPAGAAAAPTTTTKPLVITEPPDSPAVVAADAKKEADKKAAADKEAAKKLGERLKAANEKLAKANKADAGGSTAATKQAVEAAKAEVDLIGKSIDGLSPELKKEATSAAEPGLIDRFLGFLGGIFSGDGNAAGTILGGLGAAALAWLGGSLLGDGIWSTVLMLVLGMVMLPTGMQLGRDLLGGGAGKKDEPKTALGQQIQPGGPAVVGAEVGMIKGDVIRAAYAQSKSDAYIHNKAQLVQEPGQAMKLVAIPATDDAKAIVNKYPNSVVDITGIVKQLNDANCSATSACDLSLRAKANGQVDWLVVPTTPVPPRPAAAAAAPVATPAR